MDASKPWLGLCPPAWTRDYFDDLKSGQVMVEAAIAVGVEARDWREWLIDQAHMLEAEAEEEAAVLEARAERYVAFEAMSPRQVVEMLVLLEEERQ